MNVSNATRVDLEAADWVQRRKLWQSTEREEDEFQAWIQASDGHRVAYLRQTAVWESAGRLSVLNVPMRPAMPSKASSRSILRIAAVALVATALGWGSLSYLTTPAELTYVTPIGGREIVRLGDGTSIELNTNTALRVARGPERRVTLLRGEAFFDVHHDAANAFAVTASGYRITDIGTKFVIRASSGRIRVSLLEGSAVIAPLDGARATQAAILKPGDVAVADEGSLALQSKPMATLANALGWRHGVLIFKDTALSDAAAEFNRYNTTQIHLADRTVAKLKINGTFQAHNANAFAVSVRELFGIKLTMSENAATLAR